MSRKIILHGGLAECVGARELQLDVASPAEAVGAILTQFPSARHVIEPADWTLLVDGHDLDVRAYLAVIPFETLEIRPAVAGAEGKAGPFKILAGLLLVFGGLGGALFGGIVTGVGFSAGLSGSFLGVSFATFAKLGAVVALSGIVRTLSPSPNADFTDLEDPGDRPAYAFNSVGNRTQQGARIPIAYGRSVLGSIVVSELETIALEVGEIASGKRDVSSSSVLEVVDLVSEGPIEGLEGGLGGVYFGDLAVLSPDGFENFPGVTFEFQPGEESPAAPFVTETGRRTAVGLNVRYSDSPAVTQADGAVEWTVTDPNVDETIATIAVPAAWELDTGSPVGTLLGCYMQVKPSGGSWTTTHYPATAAEAPFALETNGATYYHANISGLAGYLHAQFWVLCDASGTPGVAYGDTVTAWVELDTTADPGTWYRFQVQATFTADATAEAIVRDDLYAPFIAARVEILCNPFEQVPGYDILSGFTVRLGSDFATRYPSDTGWVVTNTAAEIAANDGGLTPWGDFQAIVDAYAPGGFEFQLRSGTLSLYGSGPYDVRVYAAQKTDALPAGEIQNQCVLKSHTELIREELTYPSSAVVKLKIPSEAVDGTIPRRAYRVLGRTLRLPTGYDPDAGTYPGVWDGTYQASEAWSDNPALVLLDYLTNERYGLGLADDELDKWTLYECAKRCDESVAAWGGGTERRYQFGHSFQAKADAVKAAVTIAAAMDTTLFWADGRTFFSQAKPRDPVRLFGPSNVAGGEFSYTGPSVQAMKTVALVGWVNADEPFDAPIAIVERPYLEDRFGRRELEIKAIGAVTEGQALRKGRFELISGERESELCQFSLPMAEMNLAPGDVAAIQDPARSGVRHSGRVKQITVGGSVVTVDGIDSATVSIGDEIHFAYPDGGLHETTVAGIAGTIVSLDDALDVGRTRAGMPWMLTASSLEHWRVVALEAGADGRYDCTAHRMDPDLWTDVEDLDDPGTPLTISLPSAPSAPSSVVGAWEFYFASRLAETLSVRFSVTCDTDGFWIEFVPSVLSQPVFPREVYESGSGEIRVELTGTPPSAVVTGDLTAWDAAHSAVSSSTGVSASQTAHAAPATPVFSTETHTDGDAGIEVRVEWGAAAGAEYYMIVASHDGETVEDARWETNNLQARYVWTTPATDHSLRVYARTGYAQASALSLFTP